MCTTSTPRRSCLNEHQGAEKRQEFSPATAFGHRGNVRGRDIARQGLQQQSLDSRHATADTQVGTDRQNAQRTRLRARSGPLHAILVLPMQRARSCRHRTPERFIEHENVPGVRKFRTWALHLRSAGGRCALGHSVTALDAAECVAD
jgi:hypothetical protein